MEYVNHDENSRRWINEFRSKSFSKPITFESVEGNLATAFVSRTCLAKQFGFGVD